MNEFDFRKYLKHNPLLKEGQQNYLGFAPGDDSFWDQVYDAAVSQFPEEAQAIEGVISRPSRVMQALEADGEVDEAVDYVLDSLELGEPKGMGDTQKAFLYNPTNQVGFNPMREKQEEEEKEEFVGLYEDDDDYVDDGTPATDYGMRRRASDDSFIQAQRLAAGEPDEDDYDDGSDYPDARERFLGLGGQEILDNIKFLVDDGWELKDIIQQIQHHANYVKSPTINEGMDDDENPFPSLNTGNAGKEDSFIQAQGDAAGSGGYLSDYYAGAPGISNDVKVIASNVDKVLNGLDIPEEDWINVSDLIIDLADAYADFRIDMYTDGQMD